MARKDLKQKGGIFKSHASDPVRMAVLMQQWWAGAPQAQIAKERGITSQRVGQLLAWAGCTPEIWRKAKRGRADSHRRAVEGRVLEAQLLLQHPLAARLTMRQRSALLWLSQGLILTDIALRMATSAQAVRYFLVGARWRLERLDHRQRLANGDARDAGEPFDSSALDACDLGDLLPASSPPINTTATAATAKVEAAPTPHADAAPQIDRDEPPLREAQEADAEPKDRKDVESDESGNETDAPSSPPEISESDFGPPASPPSLEHKPIRLSDIQRAKRGN